MKKQGKRGSVGNEEGESNEGKNSNVKYRERKVRKGGKRLAGNGGKTPPGQKFLKQLNYSIVLKGLSRKRRLPSVGFKN